MKGMLHWQICKSAEYENSIFSLAKALEKTQKLLNALENVIIPQYQHNIRFIAQALEEKEREEFAKLKKVKAKMESRKQWQKKKSKNYLKILKRH